MCHAPAGGRGDTLVDAMEATPELHERAEATEGSKPLWGWVFVLNDGMVGQIYRCWNMVFEFKLFGTMFWVRGAPTCVNRGPDEDNIVHNRSKERANNCFKLF